MKRIIMIVRSSRTFGFYHLTRSHVILGITTLFCIQLIRCYFKSPCTTLLICSREKITPAENANRILEKEYSLCSIRSARRGPNQRVIGVSAYLSLQDNSKLLSQMKKFLLEYLDEAKYKYPDWIVRVYYFSLNITKEEIMYIEENYSNVDFCHSANIPGYGNVLDWLPGKVQRFLPLIDPLVDIYMSRDIDSPILERETAVVNIWLKSKKTIHIMRDHPEHDVPILGGLWGIKSYKERLWIKNISQYLLSPSAVQCYTGSGDQDFLKDYIWPRANINHKRTLTYDSFFCDKYPNSHPFPTRKQSATHFVGCRRPNCTTDKHDPCPEQCRPRHHPNWIWC